MSYTIYKHTLNGKSYIGQTSKPLQKRYRSQFKGYKGCQRFYNAIKKHGYKNIKVTQGTVFHGTKIELQKWFLAISLVLGAKKSLSSCQLARNLDLNQKTAWYILTRIRAEMANKTNQIVL